jgi:hypothetical protein
MKTEYEPKIIASAVESAFDILGWISKQRLLQYLLVKYSIDIRSTTESDVTRIHRAIADLFGREVAQLLMKQIYLQLDTASGQLE